MGFNGVQEKEPLICVRVMQIKFCPSRSPFVIIGKPRDAKIDFPYHPHTHDMFLWN